MIRRFAALEGRTRRAAATIIVFFILYGITLRIISLYDRRYCLGFNEANIIYIAAGLEGSFDYYFDA